MTLLLLLRTPGQAGEEPEIVVDTSEPLVRTLIHIHVGPSNGAIMPARAAKPT